METHTVAPMPLPGISQANAQMRRKLHRERLECRVAFELVPGQRQDGDAQVFEAVPAYSVSFDALGIGVEFLAVVFDGHVVRRPKEIAFERAAMEKALLFE